MSTEISVKVVETKQDLHRFVRFANKLYHGVSNWIPPLTRDEVETFHPKKNPAFENAESRLFLALRDNRPVGRIAAILSHAANRKYKSKNVRFGWFECENDPAVSSALFSAVATWAGERHMESITGPQGFTDLDPQGLLIEGFDKFPTVASNYNQPYYQKLIEDLGFEKEIDYVEYTCDVPHENGVPEKLQRIAQRVKERGNLRLVQYKSRKELIKRAPEIFMTLNEAFEEIYGTVPLTAKQIDYYVKKYITFVHPGLVKVVENQAGELVGFLITMPSLTRAFMKAKGRLFPLGWFHLLRALKQYKILDFYLAGIKNSYRGTGVDLLMAIDITNTAVDFGFERSESNLELENNTKVQAQWKYFNPIQHRRRRIFRKKLT